KRAYCLKTQPATGETYPKSDLFNKAEWIMNTGLIMPRHGKWQENGLMSVSSIYSNARTYVSVFFHYLGFNNKR
uniref:hypothetical protein n=1 Tax=Klebsiella pneumoniae TaxID=573 RepID=UPI0023B2811E